MMVCLMKLSSILNFYIRKIKLAQNAPPQSAMLMFPKVGADAVKCSSCDTITSLKGIEESSTMMQENSDTLSNDYNRTNQERDASNFSKNEHQKNMSIAKTHLDIVRPMLEDIEVILRSSPGKNTAAIKLDDRLIGDLIDRCTEDAEKLKYLMHEKQARSAEIDSEEVKVFQRVNNFVYLICV